VKRRGEKGGEKKRGAVQFPSLPLLFVYLFEGKGERRKREEETAAITAGRKGEKGTKRVGSPLQHFIKKTPRMTGGKGRREFWDLKGKEAERAGEKGGGEGGLCPPYHRRERGKKEE